MLSARFDPHRLVVCVGPGGVGKTTTSAAIALEAAARGRRVLLLTIDPAKRLADALGAGRLGDRSTPIELPSSELATNARGMLHAAMLDTKASFDALVERIAVDPEHRRRILSNPIYDAFSRTLAKSHAYVALERIYDEMRGGAYDLLVLDTPPTRSALEILDAPLTLQRFLEGGVLGGALRVGADGALSKGRGLSLLSLLVGRDFVGQVFDFFALFFELRDGFRERARAMHAQLTAKTTAFTLVGRPKTTPLADARYFARGLAQRDLPLTAVVFNRAFTDPFSSDELRNEDLDAPLAEAAQRLESANRRADSIKLALAEQFLSTLHDDFGRAPDAYLLPDQPEEPRHPEDLLRLLHGARQV